MIITDRMIKKTAEYTFIAVLLAINVWSIYNLNQADKMLTSCENHIEQITIAAKGLK